MVASEKEVLEMIATSAPLPAVLETVTRDVEAQSKGLYCSVLLMHEDGIHLRHGAAPKLPKSFVEALDGKPIGPARDVRSGDR